MRKSRLLAVALTAAMAITSLSGCSNGTETGNTGAAAQAGTKQEAGTDGEDGGKTEAAQSGADNTGDVGGAKRIALISPAQHYDFFVYLCAGAKKKADELGVQLDVFDGQEDFPMVGEYISHCVAQGYDAICTGGFEAIIPAAKEANAAGIPMVNFDARLESDEVEFAARVASDNGAVGETNARFILDEISKRTDKDKFVIYYINFMSSASNTQRCAGFVKAFDGVDNVELREIVPSAGTVEATQSLIDDLLISQPRGSIDYIFGSSAGMGVGALASVTMAGRDEIGILSVDDEQGLLDALQTDGPFLATVAQNAADIGAQTVEAAVMAIDGESAGDIKVPVRIITKENVKQDIEEQSALKKELEAYK